MILYLPAWTPVCIYFSQINAPEYTAILGGVGGILGSLLSLGHTTLRHNRSIGFNCLFRMGQYSFLFWGPQY